LRQWFRKTPAFRRTMVIKIKNIGPAVRGGDRIAIPTLEQE
jgi:hypothetical protein